MTAQVAPVQRKKDFSESYGGPIGNIAGTAIGGYLGGPAGAAAGGAAGGAVGGNLSSAAPAQEPLATSSPASRRMDALDQDPTNQMRQGKIALASMDEQTRKAFEPVLDEGLRRAAEDRKKQYGYGYTGATA